MSPAPWNKEEKAFADRLKYAVSKRDVSTARRLIKGGVNVNSTFWYDASLLHEAISVNSVELLKLLLKAGARVDARNRSGGTALHAAVRYGSIDMVDELLKAKADVNATTQDGRTCLHIAGWRKSEDVLLRVLDAGCSVNTQDGDGWSVLHWVGNLKSTHIVEHILEKGALLNIRNKNGSTPLYQSMISGNTDMCKLLLIHGADPNIVPQCDLPTVSATFQTVEQLFKKSKMDFIRLLTAAGYKCSQHKLKANQRRPTNSAFDDRRQLKSSCVQNLSEICRVVIRTHLRELTGDRSIIAKIKALPLPPTVTSYVSLEIM